MYGVASIGDKVYIGGLYGDDFKCVNNKIGILKKVYSITSENVINYLGEVQFGLLKIPVNLKYVYKLPNVSIDPILISPDILGELFWEHSIASAIVGIDDDTSNQVAICKTIDNRTQLLTLSTIN